MVKDRKYRGTRRFNVFQATPRPKNGFLKVILAITSPIF